MKIVVLDGYTLNPGDLSWSELEKYGELKIYDRTPINDNSEIIQRIGDAELVFTNKTPIQAEVFKTCEKIKFIGVLATGYDVVDLDAATENSVVVSNVPTYGTHAVAQFAIALLLEVAHHIGHHDRAVKEGRWTSNPDWTFWDYPLIELQGKTMGIIGFGRIGQEVGKLGKALGMTIIANDAYPNDAGKEIASYVDLDELFAQANVISLHAPLLPDTMGIINKENIGKMKDSVIIINNSRGPLIVEKDLADALNNNQVYAAALDVVSSEPIKDDNPLLTAKNCIITPHMSWATQEARQRILNVMIENLQKFVDGNPVNVVNK